MSKKESEGYYQPSALMKSIKRRHVPTLWLLRTSARVCTAHADSQCQRTTVDLFFKSSSKRGSRTKVEPFDTRTHARAVPVRPMTFVDMVDMNFDVSSFDKRLLLLVMP